MTINTTFGFANSKPSLKPTNRDYARPNAPKVTVVNLSSNALKKRCEVLDLKRKAESLGSDLSSAMNALSIANAEIARMRSLVDPLKAEIERLKSDIATLKASETSLMSENDSLKASGIRLQAKIDKLEKGKRKSGHKQGDTSDGQDADVSAES